MNTDNDLMWEIKPRPSWIYKLIWKLDFTKRLTPPPPLSIYNSDSIKLFGCLITMHMNSPPTHDSSVVLNISEIAN